MRAAGDKTSQESPAPPPSATTAAAITFDKDDDDTLDFVAASANIRSHIFNITTNSKFQIKEMAGNIIPAIATTNAMTAALCVLQAYNVLRDDLAAARMIFLERTGARAINTDTLKPPNPDCPVCSTVVVRLEINSDKARLADIVEDILVARLGYTEFSIVTDAGVCYDPDMEDNLPKLLAEVGVVDGAFATVIDEDDTQEDGLRVNLQFVVVETKDKDAVQTVALKELPEVPRRRQKKEEEEHAEGPGSETARQGSPAASSVGTKRKRDGEDGSEATVDSPMRKSIKGDSEKGTSIADTNQQAVVEIEDDVDAILLDD